MFAVKIIHAIFDLGFFEVCAGKTVSNFRRKKKSKRIKHCLFQKEFVKISFLMLKNLYKTFMKNSGHFSRINKFDANLFGINTWRTSSIILKNNFHGNIIVLLRFLL